MFVGMDLHKNYLQVAVMDERGEVVKNCRIDNELKQVDRFFDKISNDASNNNNNNFKVVMESSNVWYNIYRHLSEERHLDVRLSNPIKTRAIASAKIKTDKLDAVKLADLLRGGYIAECYVPDRKTMDQRELVRHRATLVRMRTKLKNKIHGILLMKGVAFSNNNMRPFTREYCQKLKALGDYRINGYLNIIESLDAEIRDMSKRIVQLATENEAARLLLTIPGIGYYSALLIASEIGDINRFPDSHHLCAYAGLVPSTHSSGGITYNGRITKIGSKYLRWVITECTYTHIRTAIDSNISKFYARIARKKGNGVAIVATASKLMRVVYWVLKEKRVYHS